MDDRAAKRTPFDWELAAETITVRIRWFGLLVGLVLVNALDRTTNQPVMNAILALGAGFAIWDTLSSWRRRVFLGDLPIFVSLMEAVFIGLLCHFDNGLGSPFRFYYCLSLLVCALRYSPAVTYATCLLHAVSFTTLMVTAGPATSTALTDLIFMLVLMGWLTWAGTSLASLIKSAGAQLVKLNEELKENQSLLEDRIAERTRELQQSQALLVQQEKQAAFGLLAAGIAHEVGNPLAAISSLVQLLRPRHQDAYTSERLALVDEQLCRIQSTLRELIDFSRPASPARMNCDINHVVNAALNIAKYYKRKKGRRIETRLADDLPKLWSLRDQLVQVILNLILNALDATQEGGRLEIATQRSADKDGVIEVFVRDDGHGIDQADRQKIFQPYYTTKTSGTGLGLFVCRHIIEQLGDCTIELRDSDPTGTTFVVQLGLPRGVQVAVDNHPSASRHNKDQQVNHMATRPASATHNVPLPVLARSYPPASEESCT